jgi:hypothetical protein
MAIHGLRTGSPAENLRAAQRMSTVEATENTTAGALAIAAAAAVS